MAKPPSDDPRMHTISIRLTESEKKQVDKRRGAKSTSTWLRGLIFKGRAR